MFARENIVNANHPISICELVNQSLPQRELAGRFIGDDSPELARAGRIGSGKLIGYKDRAETLVWQQQALDANTVRISPPTSSPLVESYFSAGRTERNGSIIRGRATAEAVNYFGRERGLDLVSRLDDNSLANLDASNYQLFREMRSFDVFNRLPGVNVARAVASELRARARVEALMTEHAGPTTFALAA